ncbi:8-oxoguanine DNA glycosylase OGG fold protein [Pontibacter sp. H249]|uniref:8-oxoguanine DNA glycosylase OGG fold protein n=1 Tax=Pontibacter sp. H249 TaxID=3133420 RepID=UPI0030BA6742
MTLDTYQPLLQSLPVLHQSFTTKRSNWTNAEKQITWLQELNDQLFQNHPSLELSRQDLFSHTGSTREMIVKVIYWGYPKGMRGNHFVNILMGMPILEAALDNIKVKSSPDDSDYESLVKSFDSVPGLGMSTFSKILYFMKITFNGNPSLILDLRLIDVFKSNMFADFVELKSIRYDNTRKHFLNYIRIMNELANKLGTSGECIEQFLFIFGNNLKAN